MNFKNCQGGQLVKTKYILQHVVTYCTIVFRKQKPYLLTNNRGFSRAILCPPMEKPRLLCVKPANNQDYQLKQLSWQQQQLRSSASVVVKYGRTNKNISKPGVFRTLVRYYHKVYWFLKGKTSLSIWSCHSKVGLKFHGKKWYPETK